MQLCVSGEKTFETGYRFYEKKLRLQIKKKEVSER